MKYKFKEPIAYHVTRIPNTKTTTSTCLTIDCPRPVKIHLLLKTEQQAIKNNGNRKGGDEFQKFQSLSAFPDASSISSRRFSFFPLPFSGGFVRSRLSPRFTRAIANLFRRVGDGVGRNRSTLYSSRIDRQPRTDMEALYFPSSHLLPVLLGPLVNKASTFLARSFIISLPVRRFPTLSPLSSHPYGYRAAPAVPS